MTISQTTYLSVSKLHCKPTRIEAMAWRRTESKPLLEPLLVYLAGAHMRQRTTLVKKFYSMHLLIFGVDLMHIHLWKNV